MPGKKKEKQVRGREQDDFSRPIPDLALQESNQVIRLVQRIRANLRRAIARPEPRTSGADIEPTYRYPFPAQATSCGQTRLGHSQYKRFDPGIECFSGSSLM